MQLQINPDRFCVGCALCEYWCSLKHCGLSSRSSSRIRITWDHAQLLPTPRVCQQCAEPACVEACPENAMRKEKEGHIHVDASVCKGCRACEAACSYGAVHVYQCVARICDLCGGDPMCVKVCPVHLLEVGS